MPHAKAKREPVACNLFPRLSVRTESPARYTDLFRMSFDTPIPLWLIAVATFLLSALAVWLAWQARSALPRRYLGLLLFLRLLAVLLAALLAANPYHIKEKPDPDGVRVAVLADVSGSMATTDTSEGARIDSLRTLLAPGLADSLLGQLEADYAVEVFPFVDSLLPRVPEFSLEPGTTAIGQALDEIQATKVQDGRALGAVILLSDGISLTGESPLEVGKRYRSAGIPVSTIGIGSPRPPANLSLRFTDPPGKAQAGEPLTLNITAQNEGPETIETELEFYMGNQLMETRMVTLPAGERVSASFETLPDLHGIQTYRVRFKEVPQNDLNPADDSAYAAVEITPPDELDVLFLSNRVDYTFRFLRQMLKDDEQFKMRALIRIGEGKFLQQGFGEDAELPTDAFPSESEPYLQNRVLIVETGVLAELDESVHEALRNFLENRAGGILFLGVPENAPESLRALLPVRQTELVEAARREPLILSADPVFREASEGLLFMPPGPYLPSETPAATALELSRGARVAAMTEHGSLPVLALQAYGAGRAAYLGTESTWRWQMANQRGGEQYRLFWRYLLGWLAAGGKPRLEVPGQSSTRAVGEPLPLELRVLGKDFLPAADARIQARVSGPDGKALPPTSLTASPYEPGLFTGLTALDVPGEYLITYDVTLPDGEILRKEQYFAAARQGRENEDVRFREAPLRDLARISGGLYASYRDFENILPLNLAPNLPTVQERIYWTRNLSFLLILLGALGLEWFLRRRVGLR